VGIETHRMTNPLALLYRRFTRQFDLAEKFFSGDNSRESCQPPPPLQDSGWKYVEDY
jgi:hypothetical protein